VNGELVYFDRHFSLITGYRFLLKDIIKYLEDINDFGTPEKTLLDVGCGRMPYKKILTNWNYIGVDNVTEFDATPDLYGDLTHLPLGDEQCDLVLTVWVLDDVFLLEKAFKEIQRVLKNDGKVCLMENQSTNLHNPPFDFFRFAPNAIERLAEENGLTLIKTESYGGDFALIGFSLIIVFRKLLGMFQVDRILLPIFCLTINALFRPLDLFFRMKIFGDRFKGNSIGYYYLLKKTSQKD
jgi:SAM-dependent methyltransferase